MLNQMKNHISEFSDFHFSSYDRFCSNIHRKLPILSTKMTISQKLKIAKIRKLSFHSFQPCKFDQFWKNFFFAQEFIQSAEKNWWGLGPTGATSLTPRALGFRNLALLVSVNDIFAKYLPDFFEKKNSKVVKFSRKMCNALKIIC